MLNVTIQNDGKIKFQDANGVPVQSTNYLYLDKVDDNNKLRTVVVLSKQLGISIKEAKAIVDKVVDDKHNILVASSVGLDFINNVRNALDSVGCICKITSGM